MHRVSLAWIVGVAAVAGVLAAGHGPTYATVLGQNGRIAFAGSLEGLDEGIVAIDPNGELAPVQVTRNDELTDLAPDWSPDGTRIAFTRAGEGGIQIVNADGTHPVTIVEEEEVQYPRWSPDGTRIAYYDAIFHAIVVVNADGSDRVVVDASNDAGYSGWSPGGSELAIFDSDDGKTGALYGFAADGTGHRRLIAEGVGGWPDWSPDGRSILTTGAGSAGPLVEEHIFAVDAFGGSSRDDLGMGSQARWSPDGRRIVFTRMSLNLTVPPGQFYLPDGISVMNADGSGRTDLTPGDADLSHGQLNPSWQPFPPAIDSVEFTQAIQRWQTLGALQEDLAADGEPPVPIVAGKPAIMRVYFKEMDVSTTFTVEVSGVLEGHRHVILANECTPEERRELSNGCTSVDFYFTPPEGDWSVTLTVRDSLDEVLESHTFDLRSVTTAPITVVPVDICDRQSVPLIGSWDCAYGFNLWPISGFLRSTFPGEVQFAASGGQVKQATTTGDLGWWSGLLNDIQDLWATEGSSELAFYHGAVRAETPSVLGISGIGRVSAHAGATKLGFFRSDTTLAHELAHNFGREHVPSLGEAGCGNPAHPDPDWPYASPLIDELGYDLALDAVIKADEAKDYMAYCSPRWVSMYTYKAILEHFASPTARGETSAAGSQEGNFWLVSGSIDGSDATLGAVVELEATGPAGEGTGTYRIEARGAGGDVLLTRRFEPAVGEWENGQTTPRFTELVPVTDGTARLVIIGPGEDVLGEVLLDGATPSVAITSPTSSQALEGQQTLAWSVTDADSTDFLAWVQYSTDGGASWEMLTPRISESQLVIDTATIAGSEEAMFRVLVSDGANTGSAVAGPFVVPEKPPIAEVTAPGGTSFRQGQLVWLQGLAFDEDDGFLDGGSVTWSSNRDGALGSGDDLPVYDLSVGTHTITMTTRDSDNNVATDTITVTVFDGPIVEGEPETLSGDINCSGAVDTVDGLGISRHVAGLAVGQTEPCTDLGAGAPNVVGDVNCDDAVTAVDSLFVLRHVAGLPVNLPGGCREIGT